VVGCGWVGGGSAVLWGGSVPQWPVGGQTRMRKNQISQNASHQTCQQKKEQSPGIRIKIRLGNGTEHFFLSFFSGWRIHNIITGLSRWWAPNRFDCLFVCRIATPLNLPRSWERRIRVDRKKPPPSGGFPICTTFFEGGPLPPGSWVGNIVNRKPSRGGGVLSIRVVRSNKVTVKFLARWLSQQVFGFWFVMPPHS